MVGQTQKAYHVHENLLHANSGFLSAALKKDPPDGKVALSDENHANFYRYVQYLYTKNVPYPDTKTHGFIPLTECYTLGKRMQGDKYKDNVLNAIVAEVRGVREAQNAQGMPDMQRTYPGIETINMIFAGTPPASPARRFFVDFYVGAAGMCFSYTYKNEYGKEVPAHPDFLLAVVGDMSWKRELDLVHEDILDDKVLSTSACAYHRHAEDEACSAAHVGP